MRNPIGVRERRLRRALMAYLVGDQGLSMQRAWNIVTKKFPYARAGATADIEYAKEHGWLLRAFAFDQFSTAEIDEIRSIAHDYGDLERYLKGRSGGILKTVRVFFSGPSVDGAEKEWETRLRSFGPRAAGYVQELLGTATVIGVGWASTVSAVVDGMLERRHSSRGTHFRPKMVIPTVGESLGNVPPEVSSTNLAIRLGRALDEYFDEATVPSLQGVPSVIPSDFRGERREAVLDFISRMRSYRNVFGVNQIEGGGDPWIHRLDCILCSCGAFRGWNAYRNQLIDIGGVNVEDLARISVGDIGGTLIERPGLRRADQDRFKELSEQWTGIKLRDYQRVAQLSAASHMCSDRKDPPVPGVVLCAFGESKAEIVGELVTQARVVNHLVIDHTLAKELFRLQSADVVRRPKDKGAAASPNPRRRKAKGRLPLNAK